jgi:transposase-like protein
MMAYLNSTVSFEKMLLKFISDEDPMQSMLKWLCERLMEAEVNSKLCAEKSERTRERQGYRSGYRVRRFDTRMGTIYLMVPKIRNGGYIPFFVESKKRSEAALMNVIQEAYVNGVSTRKIDTLAKSLGIKSISRGQVSVITKELNTQVDAFRNSPLDATYPVLWVDALYERIRDTQQVKNMAVIVVTGMTTEGKRDILAVEPMYEESAASYTKVFEQLKERGLENVWLVVSDGHKGLVKAVRETFLGCSWQRCKVHFMRNILATVSVKNKKQFAEKLKQIWLQPDYESAKKYAAAFMDE